MSRPYFSVIINNYNYARFLPDAINSVLKQSFTDYEIIVVDDCSTDNSRDVILSYGDKIRPVFLERNGGQGSACNAGVEASKGELISFLDADDVFYKDKLMRVYEAAQKKPNAILIYHQCYNTNIIGEILSGPHPTRLWQGDLRKKIYRHAESMLPQTSLLTFRSDFLHKIFPMSQFFTREAADALIQYLAALSGEVACIPEPLVLYRIHGNNAYSANDFNNLEMIHKFMRRNEKEYYYINSMLPKLGVNKRLDAVKFRYYRGNLFIFNYIGWWKFLPNILLNPNFNNWNEKLGFIKYTVRKRREYLRGKKCNEHHPYSV